MITSVFSKSKPVNFIIVALAVVIVFVFANYQKFSFQFYTITEEFFKAIIALFCVFVLDFIISKNDLTKKNSYGIMTLGLAFAIFPETVIHTNMLIANMLVLFALRRLFSLHSKRKIKKKFFDATFWIGLATLFYTWAILFLIIVALALVYYWQNDIKNSIVAALGFVTVIILLLCYNIIFFDEYIGANNFQFSLNFDFSVYNSASKIIAITMISTAYLWSLVFYLKNISDKNKKMRPIHFLVILTSIIAFIIAFIAPEKNGSEFLFLFIPFSIVVANYLETITERWFKEVFVSLLLMTPILALVL